MEENASVTPAHVRRSNRRFSLIAENVKFHCSEFKFEY